MNSARALLFGLVGVFITCSAAAQSRYSIQYLPEVPGNVVRPLAINDLGHIAGTIGHFDPGGEFLQPFLWTPQDGYRFLPALPGSGGYSYPTGLNNSDQVVGYSVGGVAGSFIWSNSTGTLELPAPLGGAPGVASGISDAGLVAVDAGNRSYFWSQAGGAQFLPALPGQTTASAAGVNKLGQIVGTILSSTGGTAGVIWDQGQTPHAVGESSDLSAFKLISNGGHTAAQNVLFTPGEGFTELDSPPGASDSSPGILGVNASGVAVGHFDFEDLYRAFVYNSMDGSLDLTGLVDFGPGPFGFVNNPTILREATAINDGGVIVGVSDAGAFILTPVPEPSGWGLLVLCSAALLMTRRRGWRALAATGAVVVATSASADYKAVVFSGAPAPGTESGTNFLRFSLPALSADGSVAFQAGLAGASVNLTNDGALYAGVGGNLQLLQRKGNPADATLGAGVKQFVFSNVEADGAEQLGPAIAGGQLACFAYFTGPGIDFTNDTGIVAGPVASPMLVARYGDQAPGTPAGVHFRGFALPKINSAGQFVLPGQIDGPGITHENDPTRFSNDDGLWYGNGTGPLQLMARGGDVAPGFGGVYAFTKPSTTSEPVRLNSSGQVLFSTALLNPLNHNDVRQALYTGSPQNLRKVIVSGDPTPGIADPSIVFRGAIQSTFNNAGQIAFFGQFNGAGLFAPDGSGIFLATPMGGLASDPYSFQFLARSGTGAPGADGRRFNNFFNPLIDGSGRVVFNASLVAATGNDPAPAGNGIWTASSPTDARLLVLNGSPVAGLPAGDVFTSSTAMAVTSSGRVLIHGTLSGADVTDASDDAYYLADPSGVLVPLIREGDLLDPGDGILRPASNIGIFYSPFGDISDGASPFNDSGQLAFRVTFADQSQGIFIASAVPEPGCGALVGVAGAVLLMRRRDK